MTNQPQVLFHGEPIEIGDEVWHVFAGLHQVDLICPDDKYAIKTKYGAFTKDGIGIEGDATPTLFWQPVTIIPPPKPKKKVKKWQWLVQHRQTTNHFTTTGLDRYSTAQEAGKYWGEHYVILRPIPESEIEE